MQKIMLLLLAASGLFPSCSKRIMEAMEPHKMHDEYFILRKNGHYSSKILLLGVFRMPDSYRGRYILSHDTAYFVARDKKNLFTSQGYGIIDSNAKTFTYRMNDTLNWKILDIRDMPTRKRERERQVVSYK